MNSEIETPTAKETPTIEDSKITPITAQAEDKPISPEEIPAIPDDHIRIEDMNEDQLKNSVVNLLNHSRKLEKKVRDYEEKVKRIQVIWGDPKQLKLRLRYLRAKR